MPFKEADSPEVETYYIDESKSVTDASDRVKRILDAKYEAADLDNVIAAQSGMDLNNEQRQALRSLLGRYQSLLDGTLGKWSSSPVHIELSKRMPPLIMPGPFQYHGCTWPR